MSRLNHTLCILMVALSTMVISAKDDDVLTKCGQLSIESPTVLGRNIIFSFTPDSHDPNANIAWQRKTGATAWDTINLNYKFKQYKTINTFHLVLMDSVKHDDKQIYCVHYSNETMRCILETKKLDLEGNNCGFVQLRSEKVRYGTVDIEYYPPNNVIANQKFFKRQWIRERKALELTKGRYEEELEQNDIYVLTIVLLNDDMNGKYRVYCGEQLRYTDFVTLEIKDPPVITFNISGSVLNIIEGKQAHVECLAESVPSNISWIEELSNGNVTKKQCHMVSNCVVSIDADGVSKRQFICSTHYLTSTHSKHLTVNILERKESRLSYNANVDRIRNPQHNQDDPQGNKNEATHAREIVDEVPEYSQPIKRRTRENVDNTYSQVNKAGISAQPHRAEDGQLLYADLDIDSNETQSKGGAVKRRNSPTEYADIDYVKTKVKKNNTDTPVEPENIYTKQ